MEFIEIIYMKCCKLQIFLDSQNCKLFELHIIIKVHQYYNNYVNIVNSNIYDGQKHIIIFYSRKKNWLFLNNQISTNNIRMFNV